MTFLINGYSFSGFVAVGGLKCERFALSTEDSGRDVQDGTFYRSIIAYKHKLTVTCRPLTTEEAAMLLEVLKENWLTVTFDSPFAGSTVSLTMYSDDNPAVLLFERGGISYWQDIEFQLIER